MIRNKKKGEIFELAAIWLSFQRYWVRIVFYLAVRNDGKLKLPAGKPNNRQSSRNYNFQANRLAQQILIFKSRRLFGFCEGAYCAVAS